MSEINTFLWGGVVAKKFLCYGLIPIFIGDPKTDSEMAGRFKKFY